MTSRAFTAQAATEARYRVERKLGEGATGAVFLVRDRETGEQLALKKLFRMDAKSVLRLKREFRALQALNHPHIVKLYDMGQAEDAWFLTMEYLDGIDLATYLDGEHPAAPASMTLTTSGSRLLPAFQQLARGVHALHETGMLHRDLKPSNVLVVGDRVVMLDFGLVRELDESADTLTEAHSAAGTPAYMSPEQAMARSLTAASDWYAFGVMLYEAVSGVLPFDGPMMQLLKAKLDTDPVPLAEVVPNVPRWLNELCMALLRRDPRQRPTGPDVLARLGSKQPAEVRAPATTDNVLPTEAEQGRATHALVGRANELDQLWSALSRVESGSSVVLHVRAPSGTGKSALIEHFLDLVEHPRAGARGEALVLRSCCYELEAMPFKALDGVMDALTRHLMHLDDLEVAHLLPVDVASLAQVFPVLQRLRAVNRLITGARIQLDAVQSRLRAETALRALLDNLALRAPLVIWIDDLQWGDLDSARILRRWLSQLSAAPILFVFSYRSDEVGTSSCLQELLDGEQQPAFAAHDIIDVVPLEPEDIRALCEARLDARMPGRSELIERVVRDAHGSPFFAAQLIALADAKFARGDADLHTLSLDLMVAQTSAMLADDAKRALAVLAVAGRPMPPKLLLQAAAVKRGGRALVHDLRVLNLVRTRDVGGQRKLEIYHDRVRERVQLAITVEENRRIHQSLFDVLEHSGEAEPDWLHTLALGAEQSEPALHYGQAAAARAAASLAFERAARLYRSCVALAPAERAGEMWGELAAALARSGRGVEAAEASLEAAKHVPESDRAAWILRATSHFLRCGHFKRGEALVHDVLEVNSIDVPTSDAGLMAAIVWERTRIKLRGTRDAVRATGHSPELLERCDVFTSLYLSTNLYDPLRAALFQSRALRCALEAGEPKRLIEALSRAAVSAAGSGAAAAARESVSLLARAEAIHAGLAEPDPKLIYAARALCAFALAQLSDVQEPAAEAERLYRLDSQSDPIGNYFTRLQVASARLGTLLQTARYAELATHLQGMLDEALAHDNRLLPLLLTYAQTRWEQVIGRGSSTRARLDLQRNELPEGRFGILHVMSMSALLCSASWTGDHASAREHADPAWAKFLRSPLRRYAVMAVMARFEHARFVLNEFVAQRRGNPFPQVREDIRELAEFGKSLPLGMRGLNRHLAARVAHLNGDRDEAIEILRDATGPTGSVDMPHHRARDEYALGIMLGDGEGAELRSAAEARMSELGVVDVAADLDAYFPELAELR
ncbi:MAG TPA: protein kinase [Polyangiales bacterium]|nr:protein kinase [Polyangiales bacterium]